jgi:hypothetical protein
VTAGPQAESGQDVIFTLEPGYRAPFLRRAVTMLIGAALFGFVAANTKFLVAAWALTVAFGLAGVIYLARYLWSARFRTRLCPEGIEARGYFDHFVRWSDVTGIEASGYALPGRRPLAGPYVTPSGGVNAGYDTVRAGSGQFRRARRQGSMAGVRAKLDTVRITRSQGRGLVLRAPVVTAWQSDPQFENKVRLIHQWWQTYSQATAAQQPGQGAAAQG